MMAPMMRGPEPAATTRKRKSASSTLASSLAAPGNTRARTVRAQARAAPRRCDDHAAPRAPHSRRPRRSARAFTQRRRRASFEHALALVLRPGSLRRARLANPPPSVCSCRPLTPPLSSLRAQVSASTAARATLSGCGGLTKRRRRWAAGGLRTARGR